MLLTLSYNHEPIADIDVPTIAEPKKTGSTSVADFLKLLHPDGVFEIRIPETVNRRGSDFRAVASGYFSDHQKAARAVEFYSKLEPKGIYVTINPVSPELLGRANNRIEFRAKFASVDGDIRRRHHLFIDIDPIRRRHDDPDKILSGISATEAEMRAAMQVAKDINHWLANRGWPEPLRMMSGNGGYLIYKIDLPNDEHSTNLIQSFIRAIAARFTSEAVDVDTKVFDANRICKIGGTWARKGDPLIGANGQPDRPHRQSQFLAPAAFEIVNESLIRSVVNEHVACQVEPTFNPATLDTSGFTGSDVDNVVKRCREYIATIDPAIEGDKGECKMLYACATIARFALNESQGRPLIEEYNQRCKPPFNDKELQRKISEGRKKVDEAGEWGKFLKEDASQKVDSTNATSGNPEPKKIPLHCAATLLDDYLGNLKSGNVPQLYKLGESLNGLEVCSGLITMIGAPPGAGKTALASQILFEACHENKNLVAYVANAEMGFEAIARRELTRITKIDSDKIRFAKLSTYEIEKIERAVAELRQCLEKVFFLLNPDLDSLLSLLAKPPGLLVVDYLQKFAPPDKDARIGVNLVMTTLRRLASHGHAVLALSATKRDAKGGHASKELSLSSFRESGECEFQADSAYVLRDEGSLEGKNFVRKITLGHVKNRHGAKLDRVLRFDMPEMSFERLPEDEPERHSEFDEYATTSDGLFDLGGGYE